MTADEKHSAFFNRLDEHARPASIPAFWKSIRRFDDRIARFRESQEAVKGRVIDVQGLGKAFQVIADVLAEISAATVVLNDEAPLDMFREADFNGVQFNRLADFRGDPAGWQTVCERADAGITSAEALLAETGTVICSSGPGKSRLVSLLPPVHIVICPVERFTTDIFTWLEARDGVWPANTVLISGPSKTADIEQTMSVGMHGPKKLVVIIYGEGDAKGER